MALRPGAPLLLLPLLLLLAGRARAAFPGRRVCQGTSNQLTLLGSRENHYENLVRMYNNCNVVLENLEVTYTLESQDLSFLQSIEEVGSYVLIAMNEAAVVPLVNLRVIRGQSLYEQRYALAVMSNYHRNYSSASLNYTAGLRELRLSSLQEILRGGVKMTNNHLLCHAHTLQWDDILQAGAHTLFSPEPASPPECPSCDVSCVNGSCWAPGPQHCQKFSRVPCAEQCSQRCRGPKPADCCNEHCAAGCSGPKATDCLACRAFNDSGTCKDACPLLKIYDPKTFQVVDNPNAKFTFGATCVTACPHNYVVTEGSCVRSCGSGYYEVEERGVQRCRACEGPCPKACDGVGVGSLINTIGVNASNIESFRNCTKIRGDLVLIQTSFSGDAHYNIPPMDPNKLQYFTTVKEITGFLLIQAWPENLTSLSVFQNLEIIRGRTTHVGHSLAVAKLQNLVWLGLRSLREVSAGKVVLKDNPRLCYTQLDWTRLTRTPDQAIILVQNGLPEHCEHQNRTCDPQCSGGGCWGPGPRMCQSCRTLQRGGACVPHCNIRTGDPREVEVNGSCLTCHSECRRGRGEPTCLGPGPDQCVQCGGVQDGPHCVPVCPHGVLGDGDALIWKYADQQGRCQACHRNCSQGCSGPGLSGCVGSRSQSSAAVGVVGGLLLLVLVSVGVFVLLRRRRIRRKRTVRRLLQERELVEPLTPSGEAPNQALLRILKETELKKVQVLGSGAFGTVYKGLWIPEGENVKIPVAIKVLREATSPKANQDVLDEAYVMASVDHPHVCPLLGVCLTSSVQLVSRLMPFGCLLDYVRLHQQQVGAAWLLNWCVQIAKGMNYLEERHLVHRDLAARNVLLKNPNHVKITDFGLARLLTANEKEYHADGGKVPIKWMALESILEWKYTHQSDVWSYGVTVWELMTFGSRPYEGLPACSIAEVLERGERLPQPPSASIQVYMIMVKCWMIDPASRPRFKELIVEFSKMAADPNRFLVLQGERPSPSDRRFYARLLSDGGSDDNMVDAEEYLLPCRGLGRHDDQPCGPGGGATKAPPLRQNSVALRYITDPTLTPEEQEHDYMNQVVGGASAPPDLQSQVLNPNYEELRWAEPSGDPRWAEPSDLRPEYLNTAPGSLDNPDYREDFLPPLPGNGNFLPAAQNLEYLGLGAGLRAPAR